MLLLLGAVCACGTGPTDGGDLDHGDVGGDDQRQLEQENPYELAPHASIVFTSGRSVPSIEYSTDQVEGRLRMELYSDHDGESLEMAAEGKQLSLTNVVGVFALTMLVVENLEDTAVSGTITVGSHPLSDGGANPFEIVGLQQEPDFELPPGARLGFGEGRRFGPLDYTVVTDSGTIRLDVFSDDPSDGAHLARAEGAELTVYAGQKALYPAPVAVVTNTSGEIVTGSIE